MSEVLYTTLPDGEVREATEEEARTHMLALLSRGEKVSSGLVARYLEAKTDEPAEEKPAEHKPRGRRPKAAEGAE